MSSQQTERTEEQEAQVQRDVEMLGRILPLTEESVRMMEGVRGEVATMLQQTRRKERREKEKKEEMMRRIERRIEELEN